MVFVYNSNGHGSKPIAVLFITGQTFSRLKNADCQRISDLLCLTYDHVLEICENDAGSAKEVVEALRRYDLELPTELIDHSDLDFGGTSMNQKNPSEENVQKEMIPEQNIEKAGNPEGENIQKEVNTEQNIEKEGILEEQIIQKEVNQEQNIKKEVNPEENIQKGVDSEEDMKEEENPEEQNIGEERKEFDETTTTDDIPDVQHQDKVTSANVEKRLPMEIKVEEEDSDDFSEFEDPISSPKESNNIIADFANRSQPLEPQLDACRNHGSILVSSMTAEFINIEDSEYLSEFDTT